MKSFTLIMLNPPAEGLLSSVPTPVLVVVIGAILGVIGFYGQRYYRNRDENSPQRQLEKVFTIICAQLEKKDLSDQAKEKEIRRLELLNDDLTEKMKTGRLDLIDLRFAIRNIKRFLDDNKICDEAILNLVSELETRLKEISDSLKIEVGKALN